MHCMDMLESQSCHVLDMLESFGCHVLDMLEPLIVLSWFYL